MVKWNNKKGASCQVQLRESTHFGQSGHYEKIKSILFANVFERFPAENKGNRMVKEKEHCMTEHDTTFMKAVEKWIKVWIVIVVVKKCSNIKVIFEQN